MAETTTLIESTPETVKPVKVWYTVEELAERWGMKPGWVRDHATRKSPRIKVRKFGRFLRFHYSDVVNFEEQIIHGHAQPA